MWVNILNRATFPVFVLLMASFVTLQMTKALDGPALTPDGILHRIVGESLGVSVAAGVALPFAVLAVYAFVLSLGPKGSKEAFKE
eukprot:CAMPEP_0174852540 /NCGR_PEP_ID=MMETSP1114-20130205/25779_1 /TAXON_ID=312471 /ORGANISM="Neobodo designis, Strain CCAP 1951/1" /LENGTH=84 /DNA_ID=CAMNT_0016087145 /DNA_START=37 /DNA_END=291 /DNA_ORIENTATION=+